MRTLNTQVRLRRLIRAFGEAWGRLASEPMERDKADSFVDRLLELGELVREAWERESRTGRLEPSLQTYVHEALRTIEFAIAGQRQPGADLELLRQDFDKAALPLEFFLRGLDSEPALQRSA